MKEESKEAEIRVTLVVRKVAHLCRCNTSPFEAFHGEVNSLNNNEIIWPIMSGYRIGYCPLCGKHLPHNVPREKEG